MERYKARWVNSYFSFCLLTDLWDCWLLTTCLSIILGYHKLFSHNRILGLTQKIGFINWVFKNSIYHCTKIGIKWRMIFAVVNAICVIALWCSNQLSYEATDVGSLAIMWLFFDQTEVQRAKNLVFETGPPLSQRLDDQHTPPPPPYLVEGFDTSRTENTTL